ncbi:MAG: hypothetical protein VB876_20790 [Pirellulales bacterium]
MVRQFRYLAPLVAALAVGHWATAVSFADGLEAEASWSIVSPQQVAENVLDWVRQQKADDPVRRKAEALWTAESVADGRYDLLERTVATMAVVEPRAGAVLEAARGDASPGYADQMRWLGQDGVAPLVRNNLRLLFGRSLAQKLYFDEAVKQLDGLQTENVVDPASLLFYRAVGHHRLVQKEQGLEAVDRLLEHKDKIPRRFAVLGRLMRSDLSQVKEGSLDEISREMKDVERRLDFGRANKRVRDIEDDIIKKLDKLIEEEEKKQAAAAAASAAGGSQSSRPAPDSMPLGGKGPGKVTKKRIGSSAGWGELPPKQREEAMQGIGRDFPPHYREKIEEYFRKIANQKK